MAQRAPTSRPGPGDEGQADADGGARQGGPFRNGDQLGGCALRETALSAGERLSVSSRFLLLVEQIAPPRDKQSTLQSRVSRACPLNTNPCKNSLLLSLSPPHPQWLSRSWYPHHADPAAAAFMLMDPGDDASIPVDPAGRAHLTRGCAARVLVPRPPSSCGYRLSPPASGLIASRVECCILHTAGLGFDSNSISKVSVCRWTGVLLNVNYHNQIEACPPPKSPSPCRPKGRRRRAARSLGQGRGDGDAPQRSQIRSNPPPPPPRLPRALSSPVPPVCAVQGREIRRRQGSNSEDGAVGLRVWVPDLEPRLRFRRQDPRIHQGIHVHVQSCLH